jgi:adenosine deaminase
MDLAAFCRAIPKVELHVHLLGAIRLPTLAEMAARQGAGYTPEEVEDLARRDAKPKGVLHILRALEQRILRGPEDLHRIAYEYLEDAASQGVRHAEVFWNPTGTARDTGIPYRAGADAILAAFDDARHDHGISALLIPSIDREASPEEAVEMVEWMRAHRRGRIVGLGIDYRENDGPPEAFWKAYRMAKQAGFRLTAHAGEFGCHWRNIETALDLLEVERIDHGYTVLDNPALACRCAERGIVFTVVPTNSYYLRTLPSERWSLDHPIRRMPAAGLLVHPNTDDPPLHRVDPAGCWLSMARDFGFGPDDLRRFMLNGILGAFIPDDEKRGLAATFDAEYERLRADLEPTP